MEDDVVAEAGDLVVVLTPLHLHFDAAEAMDARAHRLEQRRIQQQLLLLGHSPPHPRLQLLDRQPLRCPGELHGSVERPQQRQAPHVPHEDPPARPHRRGRALKHPQQVVQVREVLRDRVDDHQVELRSRVVFQLVGLAHGERNLRQPRGMPADVLQRHPREVGPVVRLRVRRHAKQQQPRPAPDLQHPLRTQRQDALRRVLHPRAHLLARDRLARVAAVPPLQRQGRIFFALALRVGVVEERFPLGHLLLAAAGFLDDVRARDHVGHQAPVSGRVLPRQ
ncbi:MAG TPA: hypothetical protein VHG51_20780, partial [Longimicrobiaceae bacterium]|nr:hypothetical protein [Longimicrobiaceae bacterium]